MHSEWRCEDCGPVPPLHVPENIGSEIVAVAVGRIGEGIEQGRPPVPLWCPWPLPPGWVMTGVAWAGDERIGVQAAAVACSGPAPLGGGPADLVFVAEEPGVGLGTRLAGIPGLDAGPLLAGMLSHPGGGDRGDAGPESAGQESAGQESAGQEGASPESAGPDGMAHSEQTAHAKIRAGGHPTPLWSVKSPTDRAAYAGEARGMWLYAITWPSSAGYLLAEDVVLHDLTEWLPPELVYGAPSPYLHGKV